MMKGRSRTGTRRHERGMVLVLAMMLAVFMAVVTVPFLQRFQQLHRMTEKDFDEGTARALAEAGAERALWEINNGAGTWTGWSGTTTKTLTLTDIAAAGGDVIGDVSISVFNPTAFNPTIESTATVVHFGTNVLTSTIRLILEPKDPPLFGHGLFGNDGITLANGALVDSYDSRRGPYGWSNHGLKGHVGTNSVAEGAVYLDNWSAILGDAAVGFEGNPETGIYEGQHAEITGQKKALAEPKDWPAVPTPAGLPDIGDLTIPNNGHLNHNTSVQIGNLTLGENSTLHLLSNCDLYITGNVDMGSNSEIRIDPDARVRIYFGGNVNCEYDADFENESHDPSQLVLYGTQTSPVTIEMPNNATIYGALYFPNAFLILHNNIHVFGAVVAKNVVAGNYATIHFDRALGFYMPGFGLRGGYKVKSWQEKL